MSNDWFDSGDYTALTRNTRALAEAVMAIAQAIEGGFDLFPAKLSIQQGKAHFVASDTGAANAYVVAMEKTPPAYADGMMVAFRAANTNSGASTVNVSALGVKDLRNYAGAALSGGEILANAVTLAWYDATNGYLRILSPLVAVASVSVNNNVKGDATDVLPGTLDDKLTVAGSLSKTVVDTGGGNRKVQLSFSADEGLGALLADLFG